MIDEACNGSIAQRVHASYLMSMIRRGNTRSR